MSETTDFQASETVKKIISTHVPIECEKSSDEYFYEIVEKKVNEYLSMSDVRTTKDLYLVFDREFKRGLLRAVLNFTRNNNTQAATITGLNRGTLRKYIKIAGIVQER